MFPDEKKIKRLTDVARMYYEEDLSQAEIAKKIEVSRPMVSKLLAEAREYKIVTITINEIKSAADVLREKLISAFNLEQVIIVEDAVGSTKKHNEAIAVAAYHHAIAKTRYVRLAIGCGSLLGVLADKKDDLQPAKGEIFPLIGGIKASYRSYHPDELVRSLSTATTLKEYYLYLPALMDSPVEKSIYANTELYKAIEKRWRTMDVALVNISNIYGAPDLATSIRFGKKLVEQKAVGRFLAHYYDVDGNFIDALYDDVMQIEVDDLEKCENVVAMCADTVTPSAIIGAMNTGIFGTLVLSETMANKVVKTFELSK